ncbi:MAG: lysine--tRNA ligase, partial [Clostridia bacterium]|nr:lysine--tRNA ligase [Clostridia bacterium]
MSEEIKNNAPEQNVNELIAVRRQKLADLQGEGKDPFVITKFGVTHHSLDIKENYNELEDATVTIAGRLMSKRVM